MHVGQRNHARYKVFGQFRHFFADAIHQLLRFLTAKQLTGVEAYQVIEVCCHHGAGLHHSVALNLRLFAHRRFNPHGGQTKGRIDRRLTRQLANRAARIDRHPAARMRRAGANFDAFHQNTVARRRQFEVIADMDNRRQIAHFLREFLTDTTDTPQQFAILREIHHRDQSVTDFHPQRIFQLNVLPAGFHQLFVFAFDRRGDFHHRFFLFLTTDPPGQRQQPGSEQQEDQIRHARHHTEQSEHTGAEHHDARIAEQLGDHLLADVLIGADAGHYHTRCGGDHQRGDLRDQTVTDGQQGVAFRRVTEIHVMLQNADQQAADNVNDHDHQTGDGVTAHELTRTVHRTVEVGFLRHVAAALFGFVFTNQTGVEIGVNRHLFAGHAVEHETRAHFGDTPRTLGDNHKVNQDEDDKDHDTDGEITADQKVAEGFDHPPCRRAAGVTFQ